jgi:hypothetical protein
VVPERADALGELVLLDVVLIGQATPRHAAHFRRRDIADDPSAEEEITEALRAAADG